MKQFLTYNGKFVSSNHSFVYMDSSPNSTPTPTPVFESGFESPTYIGADRIYSGPTGENWQTNLEALTGVQWNTFLIEPAGNTAAIVTDPVGGVNKVLKCDISTHTGSYGRVQNQISFENDASLTWDTYHHTIRIYLSPDCSSLSQYSGLLWWFNPLYEIWDHRRAGTDDNGAGSAVWHVSLQKDSGVGNPLYWKAIGNYGDPAQTPIWPPQYNYDVAVPFGVWFEFELLFKRGDASNGRMYVAITVDGSTKKVLFDIHNWTIRPTEPQPLRYYQWCKFYMQNEIITYMANKDLFVCYDDFKLYNE